MSQKHDLGVQKREYNKKHNPWPLSKEQRRERRLRAWRMSAKDLFEKKGRWPRGWDPYDENYVRRLYTWESPHDKPTEPVRRVRKRVSHKKQLPTGASEVPVSADIVYYR